MATMYGVGFNSGTNQYSDQNQGSGGGFGYNSSQNAPKHGDFKKSIRPLTIRQINEAEVSSQDSEIIIDGNDYGQAEIVCIIRSVTTPASATSTIFVVEDGTGQIEVTQFRGDGASERPDMTKLVRQTYIRVTGKIRQLQNKRTISANHIQVIQDMNEVHYHAMEALYVHLALTKGDLKQKDASTNGAEGKGDGAVNYSNSKWAARGMNPNQVKVADYLTNNKESSGEGVHLHVISQKVGIPIQDVLEATRALIDEGILFTTIDEDHVEIIDND